MGRVVSSGSSRLAIAVMTLGVLTLGAGTANAARVGAMASQAVPCKGLWGTWVATYPTNSAVGTAETDCNTPVYKVKVRTWLEKDTRSGIETVDYDESYAFNASWSGDTEVRDYCGAWGGDTFRLRNKHTIRDTPSQKRVFWTQSSWFTC